MPRDRILIEGWPTLMPAPMAARYLSLDEEAFYDLVEQYAIRAVEPTLGELLWKRADLDKIVNRLPSKLLAQGRRRHIVVEVGDESASKIAAAVSLIMNGRGNNDPQAHLTIRNAIAILGISKSSIYRMIDEGRLDTCRVGGRRLIRRSSVEALIAEGHC